MGEAAEYHQRRALQERERARSADSDMSRTVHEKLAELHEAAAKRNS